MHSGVPRLGHGKLQIPVMRCGAVGRCRRVGKSQRVQCWHVVGRGGQAAVLHGQVSQYFTPYVSSWQGGALGQGLTRAGGLLLRGSPGGPLLFELGRTWL
jgi:hypothetical protein